jgi:hypothetical protein
MFRNVTIILFWLYLCDLDQFFEKIAKNSKTT